MSIPEGGGPADGPHGTATEDKGAAAAVIDEDGTVVGWTHDAHRLLGYAAEEVLGQPFPGLREPTDAAGWSGTARLRHRRGPTEQEAVELINARFPASPY
ncbi:PAS domain-containing protein [Streptomyces brasiliensis]|uniref:PAS domain-containing protein n=1 Tax=Streptomyces brasiliensis TaxID=1954 RepID=A0A917NTD4_9ACTN|nr:PAS domain-containing protein [Streptomyces brasiliensis]GGJ27957.1 hypothetical protein GCM10010121_044100 [Streptomyces brasiliensis]